MTWLPNARRVNLGSNVAGGPYDDMRKPKVCWHMTQGSGLAGARSAFAAYPPHIGYNPATRELEQYVPLDRHSYAFFNGEADDEYIIQIEVVGFSESAHLMSDEHVQNIVTDLVDPLEDLIGVPPVVIWHGFHGEGAGFILADPSSPIRISLSQLREFSGHLGHQHIPGDGHWDPGRFRIDEVLRRSQAPQREEELEMGTHIIRNRDSGACYVVTISTTTQSKWHIPDPDTLAVFEELMDTRARDVAPHVAEWLSNEPGPAPVEVDEGAIAAQLVPAVVAAIQGLDVEGLNFQETVEAVREALRSGTNG